jgi:hypothetical protein
LLSLDAVHPRLAVTMTKEYNSLVFYKMAFPRLAVTMTKEYNSLVFYKMALKGTKI